MNYPWKVLRDCIGGSFGSKDEQQSTYIHIPITNQVLQAMSGDQTNWLDVETKGEDTLSN